MSRHNGSTPKETSGEFEEQNRKSERSESELQAFENRLDALSTQVADLRDQLEDALKERDELRAEVDNLRAVNDDLQEEIARLDARTDLLELVETADEMDGRQRSVALIQHLKRADLARIARDCADVCARYSEEYNQ